MVQKLKARRVESRAITVILYWLVSQKIDIYQILIDCCCKNAIFSLVRRMFQSIDQLDEYSRLLVPL